MGSNEGDENRSCKKSRCLTKPSSLFLFLISLLLSMVGGFVLGWWLQIPSFKYPTMDGTLWLPSLSYPSHYLPLCSHSRPLCCHTQNRPRTTF
ncbi:hypothetical protein DEO72_LG1g1120 [Vigna unguiculata]|uniref:Uncharacterized protein n=1 Tax=Vigna unguiculata TaxID=3917 RepID=A0A4D6KLL3_VIGUN|nr:hypothetical protein DEO72_LG1g1120 [Vigna unguiculata]